MKAYCPIVKLLLSLALWAYALPALAIYTDCNSTLPTTLSLPRVNVPSNLAVGQAIPGGSVSFTMSVTCNYAFSAGDKWNFTTNSGAANTTAYPGVLTVSPGNTGIGFRFKNGSGTVLTPQPYSGGWTFAVGDAVNGSGTVAGTIELIKLANTVQSSAYAISFWVHVPGKQYANPAAGNTNRLNLNYTPTVVPTCTATIPSMQVQLPSVSRSSFNGLGSTSTRTGFNLGLSCEANAAPTVTLSDSTTPANGTDRLSLTASSTASGIALQLLSANQPVAFSSSGSPGSGTVITPPSPASAGQVNIPLEVQYIQNSASISPGSVDAIATFTLSYP